MFSGFNILDNQNTEDSILNDLDMTTFPKGNTKHSRISAKSDHSKDFSYSKTSTKTVQTISNIRNTKSGSVYIIFVFHYKFYTLNELYWIQKMSYYCIFSTGFGGEEFLGTQSPINMKESNNTSKNALRESDTKLLNAIFAYARENIALVNIYIKPPVVTKILRDQRTPIIW